MFFRPCGAGRSQLFSREKSCKSTHKGASPLRNPPIFLMRTQRQGLVWSIDGANCGAARQKRLSLRRALWAYHSFGLGALRSIHMKCGAIRTLALLFHRSSSYGKTDGSTPLTGPKAEVRPETRQRSDARRISHSVAGCKQGNPQTDEIGGRGVPGGVLVTLPPRAK